MTNTTLKNRLEAKIKYFKDEIERHDSFAAAHAKNKFDVKILNDAKKCLQDYVNKLVAFRAVKPAKVEDDEDVQDAE